jgi:N-acetylmuramoyl-L-alanine amidase
MEKRFNNWRYRLTLAPILLNLIVTSLILSPLLVFSKERKGLETVVIDPGHGGKDPGAMVGKVREKDIVLAIALRLGNIIKEQIPGVRVIYTRSSDNFIPLYERSIIANKNNADLFISIHANFCSSPSVKGTETYVLGLHRTEDNLNVAKKENSVILLENDYTTRYEGFDPNLSESYIMFELIQDTNIDQSVAFAGILQDSFLKHAQRASRDVRQAGFLVLRETTMPGVLIETGYLSNRSEANYLMTDEGRMTLALSIFNSFKTYKEKFESRQNLASAVSKNEPAELSLNSDNSKQTTEKIIQDSSGKHYEVAVHQQKSPIKENVKQPIKNRDVITFAIQISAFPRKLPLNSKLFKGIENITEINVGGYFKYYCLETTSLAEVRQNISIIRNKIPDAFIIAFKNGQPYPIKEAINGK